MAFFFATLWVSLRTGSLHLGPESTWSKAFPSVRSLASDLWAKGQLRFQAFLVSLRAPRPSGVLTPPPRASRDPDPGLPSPREAPPPEGFDPDSELDPDPGTEWDEAPPEVPKRENSPPQTDLRAPSSTDFEDPAPPFPEARVPSFEAAPRDGEAPPRGIPPPQANPGTTLVPGFRFLPRGPLGPSPEAQTYLGPEGSRLELSPQARARSEAGGLVLAQGSILAILKPGAWIQIEGGPRVEGPGAIEVLTQGSSPEVRSLAGSPKLSLDPIRSFVLKPLETLSLRDETKGSVGPFEASLLLRRLAWLEHRESPQEAAPAAARIATKLLERCRGTDREASARSAYAAAQAWEDRILRRHLAAGL